MGACGSSKSIFGWPAILTKVTCSKNHQEVKASALKILTKYLEKLSFQKYVCSRIQKSQQDFNMFYTKIHWNYVVSKSSVKDQTGDLPCVPGNPTVCPHHLCITKRLQHTSTVQRRAQVKWMERKRFYGLFYRISDFKKQLQVTRAVWWTNMRL